VEFHTFGDTATWQLARHYREGGLRDMRNPNLKNQPDTYAGHMWYTGYEDNGGVHINSGVQNFWFYLLCEGGSGVNDHQVSYSVNAIGMDTAIKIAYRNLTEYLTSTSDYFDSRIGSMLATADLYGKNSAVYQEVDKAWDAVGVIDEPIITSLDLYDITATTVKIKGSLMPRGDSVTYHFEYGTTPAYESATPAYAYANTVEGTLTGLQSATRYYLRLVATNENGVTFFTTEFTTLSLAPLVNIKQTVDVTETTATLYGAINPNSLPTSFYFEYGPTPALGQVTPTYPLSDTTEFLDVAAAVTNLQPRQTYYYRLVALNSFASPRTEAVSFFTATKPVISSFAPVNAPVGTAITITGYNFNPSPEKNQVSFGATRAAVLSASSTEISVEVPAGASFGSITLLDAESGLTAKSGKEFVPTFTGEFKKSSLQLRVGSTEPSYQTLVQDMDGDNKPDIVTRNNQGFSVLINVNQGGDITDESFVRSTFSAEYGLGTLSLADFDGNGLQDIVGQYQRALRIYPNFSVPGYIFFGTPIDLPFTDYWEDMVVNDFDMDGRIDIATTRSYGDSSTVTIIRNQNPKGSLSANNFEHRYFKILPYLVYSLNAGDVNNDGSPDLVVGPYYTDFLSILINNCQPGVFEFEENTIPVGTVDRWARYLANDLNEDGWKDITFHSPHLVGKVSVFENKGTLPDISLAEPVVALNEYNASSVKPGDINGDGKVDLMVGTDRREFIFLENNRDAGEHLSDSSFTKFGQYGMSLVNSGSGEVQHQMTINDLNGDGRPDIITAYSYNFYPHDGYQMEIWQNSPDDCPDPTRITVNASGYAATLTLPPGTILDQFEIEYSPSGADYWWQASTTTLSNLSRGYAYQLRARAKCYLGFTAYHHINFVTECVNTNDFTISNIGFNSATLASANLSLMEVQYSPAGKNQWKIMPEYANQISDLLPGTVYDLRFRGRCNVQSNFKYQQFTTLCPMLSELLIDDLTYNKAVLGWSSNYPGNALLEYSTDNISWILIDESQIMFPLVPGRKYFIRGALACTNVNSDFRYQSFTTPCPQLSALRIDTVTPFSARIYWSDESNTGHYTITYSMAGSSETTIETSSASFTLDGLTPGTHYRVAVAPHCLAAPHFTATTFGTVCYVPFNLSADAITHTTAELSWNDNFSGLPYVVEYSIAGSNVWMTAETALTSFSLAALRPGTKYEARVHITCTSETAPHVSLFFETLLYTETAFFPNPTDGKLTIQPSKNLIGCPFSISDNLGRIVAHGELPGYTVDLSPFSSGIFTLKIEGEKPIRIFKQ
jgi:hypothetical protein